MLDPELKQHLEIIEQELKDLRVTSTGLWSTLLRGAIYGAGYIIGAVLIIIMVGWFLNIVGIIPAFSSEVRDFRAALERINSPVK